MTITNTEAVSDERLRDLIVAIEDAGLLLHDDMTDAAKAVRELISIRAAAKVRANSEGDGEFQSRVAKAHHALFHDDPTDVAERRDRFYEEATEAVQSFGMTEAEAHALVAYTFSRPVGAPEKEIGAAALTLASLCVEAGYDMMACAEADLAALVTPEKIAKVRAKRATRHGRGPLPGLDASIPATGGEKV